MTYDLGMIDMMQGFRGSEVQVNGVIRPKLTVPAGLVRLRILNASNARMYDFGFTDGRRFHQVASDGGLLPAPVAMDGLQLAPAERAEIVVDFSNRSAVRLVSRAMNGGMMGGGGMMGNGGMMGGGDNAAPLDIISFDVGDTAATGPARLPASLPSELPDVGAPARTREFMLNVHAGSMMGSMFNNLIGRDSQIMGTNGQ
jgi:blue copper oxidase